VFLLRELWRRIVVSIRRRFREIRDCRPCYKIGLDTPGPPGPEDVITATPEDDEWVDHTTFAVHRRRDGSSEQIDLRKEEIN